MQDDKRRLREEKRILKRAGQKHARCNAKRAIRDDLGKCPGRRHGLWKRQVMGKNSQKEMSASAFSAYRFFL